MKKLICLILILLISVGILSSCKRGISFTVYVGEGTASLDPKKCTTRAEETYMMNLFCGLYKYVADGEGYKLVPDEADALPTVTETEDGKFVYTFRLREGLKWSSGEPITPEDYATSWNEAAAYSLYTDKGYVFSLIDGYESFLAYDEDASLNITFDNERRILSVTVTECGEKFLSYTATPVLFPTSRRARIDSPDWASDPEYFASNGAFTLSELSKESLTVKKNPNYRSADSVLADEITFLFDKEKAAKDAKSGKLDFAFTEGLSFGGETEGYVTGTKYLAFNAADKAIGSFKPAHQRMIREAISIYVRESKAFSNMPDSLCGYLEDDPPFVGDLAYADGLMEKVANESDLFVWQNGKAFEFPVLTALSAGRDGEDRDLFELADYLYGKGISLRIQSADWNSFLDMRDAGEYSLMMNAWSYSTLSDGEFLHLFASDSIYNDTRLGFESESEWKNIYDERLLEYDGTRSGFIAAYSALKESCCLIAIGSIERRAIVGEDIYAEILRNGTVRFY